jgi:hypothetical protein
MGKVKRKKQTGFNTNQFFYLGDCFIANSHASDAHAVYIGMGRGSKGFDLLHISSHRYVTRACEILRHCKQILKKIRYKNYRNSFEVREAFVPALIAKLGDYPSDDAEYRVDASSLSEIHKWAAKGNILGVDKLPAGINVETVKPGVVKKWKVFSRRLKYFKESDYGDPNANHQFYISQKENLLLPIKDFEGHEIRANSLFDHYVIAAHLADFANKHNRDLLTIEELTRLLGEALSLIH